MGAKYDLLKVTTIAGTIFSVYHAFTDSLLLEDLLLVITIAVTLVVVTREMKKTQWHSEPAKTKDLGKVIAEEVEKDILTA